MRSKRLTRQFKKCMDSDLEDLNLSHLKEWLKSQNDGDEKTTMQAILDGFPDLLEQVDDAYQQLDEKAELAQRSLEVSSKELTESNSKLFAMNQTFDAMVNSLGQGFFLFGRDGNCLGLSSKVCQQLLECDPGQKPVADVLKVPEEKRATFTDWYNMLFDEVIDFEELAVIGQKIFPHSGGRIVGLEYKPVRDSHQKIQSIVVIATDRTAEIEAERKAQGMQAYATLVVAILRDRPRFKQFVDHARRFFQEMKELSQLEVFSDDALTLIRRHLHTLKGAAGTFGMLKLKDRLHDVETQLAGQVGLTESQKYLRSAVQESNELFLAILEEHRDIIGDIIQDTAAVREVKVDSLHQFAGQLKTHGVEHVYSTFVDEILCVPLWDVLKQFETVIQSTAKTLKKKVAPIVYTGENLPILPESYGEIWESLSHLFRNLVDHGIEDEKIREQLKKDAYGQVRIQSRRLSIRDRNFMEIRITDDGKGIDPDVIRRKLVQKGNPELANKPDSEVIQHVFDAGFSTAAKITAISGRGVGLDVVRGAIVSLGGQMRVESKPHHGTTFVLTLPFIQEPVVSFARVA